MPSVRQRQKYLMASLLHPSEAAAVEFSWGGDKLSTCTTEGSKLPNKTLTHSGYSKGPSFSHQGFFLTLLNTRPFQVNKFGFDLSPVDMMLFNALKRGGLSRNRQRRTSGTEEKNPIAECGHYSDRTWLNP